MPTKLFIIQQDDRETIRVRAASFTNIDRGGGYWELRFYAEGEKKESAVIMVRVPYSAIPQDMLYDSLADSLILPAVPPPNEAEVEFLTDSLFSDAEKTPFTLEERRLLIDSLQDAKHSIKATFETTDAQQTAINQKLDYLGVCRTFTRHVLPSQAKRAMW
jgi:hypothetical protein